MTIRHPAHRTLDPPARTARKLNVLLIAVDDLTTNLGC